jgi:RHS repeat-associated protein
LTTGSFGNGLFTTRAYDTATGRLTGVWEGTGHILGYTYDDDGLLEIREDYARNRRETFEHDDLHRLKRWKLENGGSTRDTRYAYDNLGNLTTVRVDGQTWERYYYNAVGKAHAMTKSEIGNPFILTHTYEYDARGRQWSAPGRQMSFTERDLPLLVNTPAGSTRFWYDSDGGRVKRTGPDGTTISIRGAYERRTEGSMQTHVFYVQGSDGPVAQITWSGLGPLYSSSIDYLHSDRLGSVNLSTSASGSLGERYDYEPFGRRVDANGAVSGAGGRVKLSFAGHQHDDDLQLIDMRGRSYDPRTRRFLTPDPLVTTPLDGQSYNRYSYVRNTPTDLVDPSGFEWTSEDGLEGCAMFECLSPEPYDPGYYYTTPGDAGMASSSSSQVNPVASPPSAYERSRYILPSSPCGATAPATGPVPLNRICSGLGDSGCTHEDDFETWMLRNGNKVAAVTFAIGIAPITIHTAWVAGAGLLGASGMTGGKVLTAANTYGALNGLHSGGRAVIDGIADNNPMVLALGVVQLPGSIASLATSGTGVPVLRSSMGGGTPPIAPSRHLNLTKPGLVGGPRAGNPKFPAADFDQEVAANAARNHGTLRCEHCGVALEPATPYSPNALRRDHIFACSRGGGGCGPNLQLLCETCNQAKSDSVIRMPVVWGPTANDNGVSR